MLNGLSATELAALRTRLTRRVEAADGIWQADAHDR
jgi:hypothetical protein